MKLSENPTESIKRPERIAIVSALLGIIAFLLIIADPIQAQGLDAIPDYQEMSKNFPSFRGVGGCGIAYQKNIPVNWDGKSGKNILWKTAVPLPGCGSPVYWDGFVFLTGADANTRELYCFDANTGRLVWKAAVAGIQGSPTGSPKVSNDTGYAAPTLTTDGIKAYAIFANGDMIAVDFKGNKIWSKNLGVPQNHYGYSSSLHYFQGSIIVQYDQGTNPCIMALSAKDGRQVWKTTRNVGISWASPIIANTGNRTEILAVAEPFVASYNPVDGQELWKFDCITGEVGPSLAYADGVVFSVNEYSKVAAVQVGKSPKQLWEDDETLSDIPSPVATDKYLFLPTSYGAFVCYDAKTGVKYWTKKFSDNTWSSPILAEGRIYLMDRKGIMHIFKADKTFESVGDPQLGEPSVCTPAFADGRIFIRGEKNLYCVGE